MDRSLIVIAHNIRSAHNIGSLLRTCDGLGVDEVIFCGYSPYPKQPDDKRLPHLADRIEKRINKTALGAQFSVKWSFSPDLSVVISDLKAESYVVAGLEQTANAVQLPRYKCPYKLAILLGNEVTGIDDGITSSLDTCLEIPMLGKKESFNVVEAATMALYHCRYL